MSLVALLLVIALVLAIVALFVPPRAFHLLAAAVIVAVFALLLQAFKVVS